MPSRPSTFLRRLLALGIIVSLQGLLIGSALAAPPITPATGCTSKPAVGITWRRWIWRKPAAP